MRLGAALLMSLIIVLRCTYVALIPVLSNPSVNTIVSRALQGKADSCLQVACLLSSMS